MTDIALILCSLEVLKRYNLLPKYVYRFKAPIATLSSNKYPIKCDRRWTLLELWSLDRIYLGEDNEVSSQ